MFSYETFLSLPVVDGEKYLRKALANGCHVGYEPFINIIIQYGALREDYRLAAFMTDYFDISTRVLRQVVENINDDNPSVESSENIFFQYLIKLSDALLVAHDFERHMKISMMLSDMLMEKRHYEMLLMLFMGIQKNKASYNNEAALTLIIKRAIEGGLALASRIGDNETIEAYLESISLWLGCSFDYFNDADYLLHLFPILLQVSERFKESKYLPIFTGFLVLAEKNCSHRCTLGEYPAKKAELLERQMIQCRSLLSESGIYEESSTFAKELEKINDEINEAYNDGDLLRQRMSQLEQLPLDEIPNQEQLSSLYDKYDALLRCLDERWDSEEDKILAACYYINASMIIEPFDAELAFTNARKRMEIFDYVFLTDNLSDKQLAFLKMAAKDLGHYYWTLKNTEESIRFYTLYLDFGNRQYKALIADSNEELLVLEIQKEDAFYHLALIDIISILTEWPQYTEIIYERICQRKNIFYLASKKKHDHKALRKAYEYLNDSFSVAQLRQSLPDNAFIVDFIYIRDPYVNEYGNDYSGNKASSFCLAFAFSKDREILFQYIEVAETVAVNISRYRDSLFGGTNWNEVEAFWSDRLKPIIDCHSDKNRIFVCSEGDLNNICFGTFPYKDKYVLDYFAIRNIANVYDIIHVKPRLPVTSAVIVHDPEYGSSLNNIEEPLGRLFYSNNEADAVIGVLYDIDVDTIQDLTQKEASVQNIKNAIQQESPGVLHFSTHGGTRLDKEINIFLSGANHCKTFSTNPKKPYKTLHEVCITDNDISQFDLSKTTLVFYSLCSGGEQSNRMQQSLSGLISASLSAGAGTIVAPIAPVPDLVAFIIATAFYKVYFLSRKPPEVALQQAILAVRSLPRNIFQGLDLDMEPFDGALPFGHPKWWAQWVCYSVEAD